jgi:hypothetical protein
MSLRAAGFGAVATARLPVEFQLIISFDLAAIAYVGSFVALMSEATPEYVAKLSSPFEPSGMSTLVGVIALSLISITAVATLQHMDAAPRWLQMLQLAASLAAICLA